MIVKIEDNKLKNNGSLLLYLVFVFLFLQGCASEFNLATGKEETLIYNTEKEVNIGSKAALQVEAHYEMVTDVDKNERAKRVLARIVDVCDRKDIVYFVKIIDEDILNAVSLPGGYVYVFNGVFDKIKSDDELAAVIAHEVGHITARHGVKRMQAAYGAILLQVMAVETNANVAGGVNLALNSIFMQYSQDDELEADRLSVKYLKAAGYDPNAIRTFLEKMEEAKEKEPSRPFSYWRTHPFISQRIAAVNQEITGKLQFKDYLNLMNSD